MFVDQKISRKSFLLGDSLLRWIFSLHHFIFNRRFFRRISIVSQDFSTKTLNSFFFNDELVWNVVIEVSIMDCLLFSCYGLSLSVKWCWKGQSENFSLSLRKDCSKQSVSQNRCGTQESGKYIYTYSFKIGNLKFPGAMAFSFLFLYLYLFLCFV